MPMFMEVNGVVIKKYDFIYMDGYISPPCKRNVEITIYSLTSRHRDEVTGQMFTHATDFNGVVIYCDGIPDGDKLYDMWESQALPSLHVRIT